MVVSVLADGARGVGIPDDNIGVRANGNDALTRVHVEDLGGVCARHSHKLVGRQFARVLHPPKHARVTPTFCHVYAPYQPSHKRATRTTPFSQMTDMRSSVPLTPFGMPRKSSLPSAFWFALKVQLSVPVHQRSPLASRSMR